MTLRIGCEEDQTMLLLIHRANQLLDEKGRLTLEVKMLQEQGQKSREELLESTHKAGMASLNKSLDELPKPLFDLRKKISELSQKIGRHPEEMRLTQFYYGNLIHEVQGL
jgi:uncharacterized coiled-coil DUF342 family protein